MFSDPDNDVLTYSATNLANYMTFYTATGELTGTTENNLYDTYVWVTATDPSGQSSTATLSIYAQRISNWNDTVIFFVMLIIYLIALAIGIPLLIIFRRWLGVEPPTPDASMTISKDVSMQPQRNEKTDENVTDDRIAASDINLIT